MSEILVPSRQVHEGPKVSVAILSRSELELWDPGRPYAVVSICDPGARAAPIDQEIYKRWLFSRVHLYFYDTLEPYRGYYPIQPKQAVRIARFVRWVAPQAPLIVCQCEAGISRSAAVAAAIWQHYHGEALSMKGYCPNRLVYDLVLKALAEQGKGEADGQAEPGGAVGA